VAKVIPISERFQHFVEELRETSWGELYGQTRQAWKKFYELQSERMRGPLCRLAAAWAGSAKAGRR